MIEWPSVGKRATEADVWKCEEGFPLLSFIFSLSLEIHHRFSHVPQRVNFLAQVALVVGRTRARDITQVS